MKKLSELGSLPLEAFEKYKDTSMRQVGYNTYPYEFVLPVSISWFLCESMVSMVRYVKKKGRRKMSSQT